MISNLIQIIILSSAMISRSILILREWNLIRNTYYKIKTLFSVYILWSKEDRIRAIEIKNKYQLPKDTWIKDENQIKTVDINEVLIRRKQIQ